MNILIVTLQNDDARRLFENCKIQASRVCNPIIDWTDNDVWEYKNRGRDCVWQTGIDVFHWWMEDGVLSGQMEFEGF